MGLKYAHLCHYCGWHPFCDMHAGETCKYKDFQVAKREVILQLQQRIRFVSEMKEAR